VLQVPGRREKKAAIWGTHEDSARVATFFASVPPLSSCSVPCADAGQEVTLGISERNHQNKISIACPVESLFFTAGGDTADPTTAALGYLTCIPRHRHEADRSMGPI
jgi:hypothetical protein